MKSEDLIKFDELVVLRMRELLSEKHGIRVNGSKEDVLAAASGIDAAELNELAFALRRIEKGVYGQCVICRHDIPGHVLRKNLTARFCPSCETVMHDKTDPSS